MDTHGCEVLLFCSDQHTASVSGFMGDPIVRTPNLDRLAREGVVFDNAYTSCPLCAPARASLMTGRIPSKMEMFNNACDYRSSEITFAHLTALAGYDSVLIGRMHFNGMDFHHGFTRRVGQDITGSYWGYSAQIRPDLGDFARGMNQKGCLELIGSGDTPIREYDWKVVADALGYLSRDYERPQMVVVGTYGPHFPYVADAERMEHYRDALRKAYREERASFPVETLNRKIQYADAGDVIELRAAYYALVEEMDEQLGQIYTAFQRYLERNRRRGIFVYLSDHGDQIGYKQLYGKQTFFERSAKIPLVFAGCGLTPGRIHESVSILDLAPTLCRLTGAPDFPDADGSSLLPLLQGVRQPGRYAVSEFYDVLDQQCCVGRMIHQNGKKLICYGETTEHDMLFDTDRDPDELENLAGSSPELCHHLRELLMGSGVAPDRQQAMWACLDRHRLLTQLGKQHPEWNPFTYTASQAVRKADRACKRPKRS